MIKIAVFGHSSDSFSNINNITNSIDDTIAIIKRQHGAEKDFKFLLSCDPGISQWFCDILIKKELPYELFLSSTPNESSQHWSEEQQDKLLFYIEKANIIHICGMNNSYESRIYRDKQIIDASQWVLVYWNNKHQGATYRAIEYSIKSNKIVYNGLQMLKLIDGNALNTAKNGFYKKDEEL